MKITITIPEEVYGKLETDRGLVPRSTYLQSLIMGGVQGKSAGKGTIPSVRKGEIVGHIEKSLEESVRERFRRLNSPYSSKGVSQDEQLLADIEKLGWKYNRAMARLERGSGRDSEIVES